MTHLSRLSVPAYVVCLWLILFSMADALLLALPITPTSAIWRYSVANLVTQHMLSPIMGMFIALVLGAAFEHPRILKTVAAACALAGTASLVLLGVFVMASFEMQGVERQGLVPPFSLRWGMIFVKLLFAAVAAGAILVSSWGLAQSHAGVGTGAQGRVLSSKSR